MSAGVGVAVDLDSGDGISALAAPEAAMIGIANGGIKIAPAIPAPITAKCATESQKRFMGTIVPRRSKAFPWPF